MVKEYNDIDIGFEEENEQWYRSLDDRSLEELSEILTKVTEKCSTRCSKLSRIFDGYNPTLLAVMLNGQEVSTKRHTKIKLDEESVETTGSCGNYIFHPSYILNTIPFKIEGCILPSLNAMISEKKSKTGEHGEMDINKFEKKLFEFAIGKLSAYLDDVMGDSPSLELTATSLAIQTLYRLIQEGKRMGINKIKFEGEIPFPGTNYETLEGNVLYELTSLLSDLKDGEFGKYQAMFFVASHNKTKPNLRDKELEEEIWRDVRAGMDVTFRLAEAIGKCGKIVGKPREDYKDFLNRIKRARKEMKKKEDEIKENIFDSLRTEGRIYEVSAMRRPHEITLRIKRIDPDKFEEYDICDFEEIGGYRDKIREVRDWCPFESHFPMLAIVGPAGIGKSKLAKAKLKELAQSGYTSVITGKMNDALDLREFPKWLKEGFGSENLIVLIDDFDSKVADFKCDLVDRTMELRDLEEAQRIKSVRYIVTLNPVGVTTGDDAWFRRLGLVIRMGYPNTEDRTDIIRKLASKYNIQLSDGLIRRVAEDTYGFTGDNLKTLVKYVADRIKNSYENRCVEKLLRDGIRFVRENYIRTQNMADIQKSTGQESVWREMEEKENKYEPRIYF